MQSPIPPTKPIPPTPPTPPTMKTSTETSSTDSHIPAPTTSQSVNPPKAAPISQEQQQPPSTTSTSASTSTTNKLPPAAAVSTSNDTSTETTAEKSLPPTTNLAKSNSATTGFNVFFILVTIIAIGSIAAHWWKNHKPKPTVDYSTESSDEMISLILSQVPYEPATQAIPKTIAKKIIKQTESTPKTKGHFEIRV